MRFIHLFGFHSLVSEKPLITMSLCRCVVCKRRFVDTFYGLFDAE
jgi:hypothetical protein